MKKSSSSAFTGSRNQSGVCDFEKRIEGKTEEAIKILNALADEHPHSVEVLVQLARTLMDARDFPLAAFRFEEAFLERIKCSSYQGGCRGPLLIQ